MWNNNLRYAILVLFLLTTACASTKPGPQEAQGTVEPEPAAESTRAVETTFSVDLDRPFQLGLGQTAAIRAENLEITYADFIEDSRCPPDVECEWPGEIAIQIAAKKDGQALGRFRLSTYSAQVMVDGYLVIVETATDDYVFTLVVSEETTVVDSKGETVTSSATPTFPAEPHNCAYGYSNYFAPQSSKPEIHIIGFYETSTLHNVPGTANIYIERGAADHFGAVGV